MWHSAGEEKLTCPLNLHLFPVCLREYGATWRRQCKTYCAILPRHKRPTAVCSHASVVSHTALDLARWQCHGVFLCGPSEITASTNLLVGSCSTFSFFSFFFTKEVTALAIIGERTKNVRKTGGIVQAW